MSDSTHEEYDDIHEGGAESFEWFIAILALIVVIAALMRLAPVAFGVSV